MAIAALVTWIITAAGGFVLLGTWLARGGANSARGDTVADATTDTGGTTGVADAPTTTATQLPPPLIFGHFLLAVAGLVVWIAYLATDRDALAWVAFGLLLVIALLGFTMLARWIASRPRAGAGPGRPEDHFPVPVVFGHGLLAATTIVLVLLTALEVAD